jgi:hypothetical protein
MLNRYPPPTRDFFSGLSPRGVAAPLGLDIGGWAYRFEGLDEGLRESLEKRFGIFVTDPDGENRFRVRVLDGAQEEFVPPAAAGQKRAHPLSLGWEREILLVRSYGFAGWMAPAGGAGEIALARDEYEKGQWSAENFLRVCTAWRAAFEGGALLHAASVVRSGGVYIFMGASGSGKSTLAALSTQGEVISDDLTLVRRISGEFRVVGTPFRGTYQGGAPLKGLFPIGGMFRIFKATTNRLEACPRKFAVADLLASCPFVVDQISRYPAVLAHLRALDSAHPLSYLHFNLQGDFWEVLPVG